MSENCVCFDPNQLIQLYKLKWEEQAAVETFGWLSDVLTKLTSFNNTLSSLNQNLENFQKLAQEFQEKTEELKKVLENFDSDKIISKLDEDKQEIISKLEEVKGTFQSQLSSALTQVQQEAKQLLSKYQEQLKEWQEVTGKLKEAAEELSVIAANVSDALVKQVVDQVQQQLQSLQSLAQSLASQLSEIEQFNQKLDEIINNIKTLDECTPIIALGNVKVERCVRASSGEPYPYQ